MGMAVGKNKGLKIGGKKGAKKKIIDPFTRKDWYDIKAPSTFKVRQVGKTLVNRTQGTKIASDGLKGRVYEVSLADLQNENDAERSFRKFKLVCEEVQGKNCLTNFHGMGLTTDKLRSMVKKWQTLIEANCDVKTTDGYTLRLFCIGFTRKQEMSTKKTAYAHQEGEGDEEAPLRPQQADGHARRGQRQNCCDNGRCHRRGCGETRGIRASSAGVCLDNVLMALNKAC